MLEDPALAGRRVKVKAVIASNTVSYNIPLQLQIECVAEEDHDCENTSVVIIEERDMPAFVDIGDTRRQNKIGRAHV